MSFEISQADGCGIGAAVFAGGGTPLPQFIVGLDPSNCAKTIDVPAQAIIFGRITGSNEAQVDALAFGYDEAKNHQYIGTGHTVGALAADGIIVGVGNTVNAPRASILGGDGHTLLAIEGMIGGGSNNQVTATNEAAIVNGRLNIVSAQLGIIGAGENNQVNGIGGAVVAGNTNIVGASGLNGFVGGGSFNSANGAFSTVGGGRRNVASGQDSVVCGGGNGAGVPNNQASGTSAGIVAGEFNINAGAFGIIGAGAANGINANSPNSCILGGNNNQISSTTGIGLGTIVGGLNNVVTRHRATIGGGINNQAHSGSSVVGGGSGNIINFSLTSSGFEVVAGGQNNVISNGGASVISGGINNAVNSNTSVVGGGSLNIVNDTASGIFSGENNQTIGGATNGNNNGNNFIGGGSGHRITGVENVIAGGDDNAITHGTQGAIGGGQANRIRSTAGSQTLDANIVAGGQGNIIDLTVGATPSGYATIGGGQGNLATAEFAAIPGGEGLIAQGRGQIVAGHYNVAQGTSPTFVPNDFLEILGNGSSGAGRSNAYAWQHDATLIWFPNTQVPAAANNAAAIVALTAAKPVAAHLGAQTMVVVAGVATWFVCDGAVWKFVY